LEGWMKYTVENVVQNNCMKISSYICSGKTGSVKDYVLTDIPKFGSVGTDRSCMFNRKRQDSKCRMRVN
jgi:hypothetical protein